MSDAIWELRLQVPQGAQALFEAALEGVDGGALSVGGADVRGQVPLILYLGAAPDRSEITARLAAAAAAAGTQVPDFTSEMMPEIDWVAESQAGLPAVRSGRIWVYGSHVTETPPASSIALKIDANVAFGTGRHETTRLCLQALQDLARRGKVARVLDLGCGSGLLALAAARLWPTAEVTASDLDAPSIRVARENARLNGFAPRRPVFDVGAGYAAPVVRRNGPYDLIIANILAGPLMSLASATAAASAPGGTVVLSGLLVTQEQSVIARHRAAGLRLQARRRMGEWSALVLTRA
ncbi:50S ribosomal protein L11 methyltransferase [Algihabitans albus]|uniref:50S ribosomal protein L11 methyltransferase n=1 Tax=Algihabitans albus TaxID=2164067 RepID=UPI000E5D5888|nr:50S ribosomal protein L11 methyltransferase [Algihabitans albus]